MIIDSTVLIDVLRDRTGRAKRKLDGVLRDNPYFLTRFTQFEVLRGAIDEGQWARLEAFLTGESYVEATAETWAAAARIQFDLKRKGRVVRSGIDCCIAQLAIERGMAIIHNDRDFETIASVRDLRQVRIALKAG